VAETQSARSAYAQQAAEIHRELCLRHPGTWAWRHELTQRLLVVYAQLRSARRWQDAKALETEVKEHLAALEAAGHAPRARAMRARLRQLRAQ